jgi:small conductance mechanosensitive channel
MKEELATAQRFMDVAVEFIVKYGLQVIGAIIILVIGILVAKRVAVLVMALCEKRGMDITLTRFMGNVMKIIVMVFVVIITLGKFGISIAPFIAALGALAFGASFAIQGPLSNYGAGLTIIMTRPFVVGNTVKVKDVSGVVEEVGLALTTLTTEDEEKITIPNKHIVGEIITNSFENKIVETSVGISYDDDPQEAVRVIKDTLGGFPRIASEPAPLIGIEEFGDSSVNIGMRYWVPTKQYFQTLYDVNMAVYEALKGADISIPYPQRDIHMITAGPESS